MFVPQYLEQSLSSFLEHQGAMQDMMNNLAEGDPLGLLGNS